MRHPPKKGRNKAPRWTAREWTGTAGRSSLTEPVDERHQQPPPFGLVVDETEQVSMPRHRAEGRPRQAAGELVERAPADGVRSACSLSDLKDDLLSVRRVR